MPKSNFLGGIIFFAFAAFCIFNRYGYAANFHNVSKEKLNYRLRILSFAMSYHNARSITVLQKMRIQAKNTRPS